MSLTPPRWFDMIMNDSRCSEWAKQQLRVVLEAYENTPMYACPAENPTLECANCGTRVMLQVDPRPKSLATIELGWWEVVGTQHVKGHRDCLATFRPHTQFGCTAARIASGRGKLTVREILEGDGT